MVDDEAPTVWMRSLRWHTYKGQPQPEGAYYLAHEPMVETIEAVLKFAVRDVAPMKAVRLPTPEPVETHTAEPITVTVPVTGVMEPTTRPRRGKVMTTADLPTPPKAA